MLILQAWLLELAVAGSYVGFCSLLSTLGIVSNRLARKLMHIGTGPLYVLTWLLPDDAPIAAYACASVPLLLTTYFAAVGLGFVHDKSLVAGATRTGNARELLLGPVMYGVVHVVVTLMWWRHSPTGILCIAVLCGGDGAAEVIGSRWGGLLGRIPYNTRKSVVGSLSCFVGAFLTAMPLLYCFNTRGYFDSVLPPGLLLHHVAIASVVGTLTESMPLLHWDNVTVPAAVAAYCAMMGL